MKQYPRFCPLCNEKLFQPHSDRFSDNYTEIALQCRNQECWFVKDEKKRLEARGEIIEGDVWAIVGYIERSERVRLKDRVKEKVKGN